MAIALLAPATANAATYHYDFADGYIQFDLDSHPAVVLAEEGGFSVVPPLGAVGGDQLLFLYAQYFRSEAGGGGFIAHGELDATPSGPALYTGSTAAPTMRLGSFELEGNTLTVTNLSAVPEPASWALMIAGFGLAGTAKRRHRAIRPATA